MEARQGVEIASVMTHNPHGAMVAMSSDNSRIAAALDELERDIMAVVSNVEEPGKLMMYLSAMLGHSVIYCAQLGIDRSSWVSRTRKSRV